MPSYDCWPVGACVGGARCWTVVLQPSGCSQEAVDVSKSLPGHRVVRRGVPGVAPLALETTNESIGEWWPGMTKPVPATTHQEMRH